MIKKTTQKDKMTEKGKGSNVELDWSGSLQNKVNLKMISFYTRHFYEDFNR